MDESMFYHPIQQFNISLCLRHHETVGYWLRVGCLVPQVRVVIFVIRFNTKKKKNSDSCIDWTITLVKHRSEDSLKFSQCAGRKCTDWKRATCYRLTSLPSNSIKYMKTPQGALSCPI